MSAKANKVAHDAWVVKHLAEADYFVVTVFLGCGTYDRRTAFTLENARQVRSEMLKEYADTNYQRRPLIYLITKGIPLTIHVE